MEAPFAVLEPLAEVRPAPKSNRNGLRVCVLGGGGTGAALAYDLALRGFSVTVLEKGELTSGTTGRHHGQLHCGARYAWADAAIARECYAESLILSRIASECVEYNGGFFVARDEYEDSLRSVFVERCLDAGIPAKPVDVDLVGRLEPALTKNLLAAVEVPDGSFDAFRLPMMFFAAARRLGARILPWHEVTGFDIAGGRMRAAVAINRGTEVPLDTRVEADFFVSATGAWAGEIGRLAGIPIPITPAPGAMVAVKDRLINRVISKLRPPNDGDILVPQRGLTIIGSTQRLSDSPDGLLPEEAEIRFLMESAESLIPGFASKPVYAAWAAARPLAGQGKGDDKAGRALSRDFRTIDHENANNLAGFATIIGGKATVLRAMAENAADLVCEKLGIREECQTSRYRLPSWRDFFKGDRA